MNASTPEIAGAVRALTAEVGAVVARHLGASAGRFAPRDAAEVCARTTVTVVEIILGLTLDEVAQAHREQVYTILLEGVFADLRQRVPGVLASWDRVDSGADLADVVS